MGYPGLATEDTAQAIAASLDTVEARTPALGRAAAAASAPVALSTEDAAKVPALGQALAAASVPVVLPAIQAAALASQASQVATAVGTAAATSLSTTNATQLPAAACSVGCWVSAPLANTAAVYIGHSSVTTSIGTELQPGDRIWVPCSNTNLLYAITGTTTQSVRTLPV